MMHTDAKSLKARGDRLFSDKATLDTRNQEIAEQFYPERADFSTRRSLGDDWADHLMTGYPSMVRRDLGNSLGAMLRPRSQQWFHMGPDRDDIEDHASKKWMEWATQVMRRAMYDRATHFTRATKEGDHDFSAFGGCVISLEVNRRDNTLLYRNWHLRDVVWSEDEYLEIAEVHRNWHTPTVTDLIGLFGDKVHGRIKARQSKEPNAKVKCRHIIVRADRYTGEKKWRQPWVSLYIDCENEHLMEEVGSWTRQYVIPRWMTLSGSQYAYSPATLIALPDARLLQSMTLTLLEAGEKAVNPPMIGVSEAINGEMEMYPGGFTAIDAEYDERLGEVLRPLSVDKSGLPFGIDVADRQQAMMREAFYLNTLSLPPQGGPDMTAYEVGQRVQDYVRQAMPLFEPMEHEYNGALCEMTFDTLMREGAFGAPGDVPENLHGRDVKFRFESPLADSVEREKGQLFLESKAMLAAAVEADPDAIMLMDFPTALRDVLDGIGAPAEWMLGQEDYAAAKAQKQQAVQEAAMLEQMKGGAQVARDLGAAAQGFQGGEAV